MEKLLFSSLEKIFIENRIYRDIEEAETFEAVISVIDQGLEPYKPQFYREINREDILRLTEIKIKRISKFDSFKADELMRRLEEELKETEYNLAHITEYAINYYKELLKKYGKGRERKTEIRNFETIHASVVAANNQKLYVNREDGFIGYGLKKDEFVSDCSDIDDIIVFRKDGRCLVTKIQEKVFVGKDIIHVGIYKKGDERMVYNMAYLDAGSGRTMAKRFQVLAVTRDREYDLTKGAKGSKVWHFTANPNGEAEIVTVYLTSGSKAKNKVFDFDFADLEIKGRSAGGNILTKYPVKKFQLKREGVSTLGGLDIYYDDSVGRLNTEERGKKLGTFQKEDRLLAIYKNGNYELTNFELTNRFDPEQLMLLEKFNPDKVISAIYYDGGSKTFFIKRFKIETTTIDKSFSFITDAKGSYLAVVSTDKQPQIELDFIKDGSKEKETVLYDVDMLIDVKGWRAIGNRLSPHKIKNVKLLAGKASDDVEASGAGEKPKTEEDDDPEDQLNLF